MVVVSASAKLSKKLNDVAASWPIDPFRPNLQLKNFLKSLSTHPNLTSQAVQAARALKHNEIQNKVCFLLVVHK